MRDLKGNTAECDWDAFTRHVTLMRELAEKKGLRWDFEVDDQGMGGADAWDLRDLNGWPGKNAVGLPSFLTFTPLQEAAVAAGVAPAKLAQGTMMSRGWQDLTKAMMTFKCAVEQRLPKGMRTVAYGIRMMASLTTHEPWNLTPDDVLRAIEFGPRYAKDIVSICSYLDENFLCRTAPLRPFVQRNRRKAPQPLAHLEARPDADKLPERTAVYELVRIIWAEAPRTHFDEMRFYASRLAVLTGLRANEIVNLPEDCIRIETLTDAATGRPAGTVGGVSEVMYLRYFAEKTASRKTALHLYEKRQYVPSRFQAVVQRAVDEARQASAGLRATLRSQLANGGRIFGAYPPGHQFTLEDFIRLFGLIDNPGKTKALTVANWASMPVSDLPTPITVDFLEAAVAKKPDRRSDLRRFTLDDGKVVDTADLLFLVPTKNAGIRGDALSRYPLISVLSAMQLAVGLGLKGGDLSLFGRYGAPALRDAAINPHALRHLQNTELFRLGVSDTIITHHFGRESVAQSYEYDHRSLLERLDAVTLPDVALEALGDGPAELVGKLVLGGFAEESHITKTFKKVQTEHGDQVAFEYLKANADGFHITPYGFCANSFSLNPCSRHLKCFDECRHFMVTGSQEHTVSLEALRKSLGETRERVLAKPAKTAGRKNQLVHVERLLSGIDTALQTSARTAVFPEGRDHSQPEKGLFE